MERVKGEEGGRPAVLQALHRRSRLHHHRRAAERVLLAVRRDHRLDRDEGRDHRPIARFRIRHLQEHVPSGQRHEQPAPQHRKQTGRPQTSHASRRKFTIILNGFKSFDLV